MAVIDEVIEDCAEMRKLNRHYPSAADLRPYTAEAEQLRKSGMRIHEITDYFFIKIRSR